LSGRKEESHKSALRIADVAA